MKFAAVTFSGLAALGVLVNLAYTLWFRWHPRSRGRELWILDHSGYNR